jgi:DNA processing protein
MLNERFFPPMTDTEACIALNMVSGVGPIRMRRLMEAFGSPQKILGTNSTQLRKVEGIGAEVAEAISSWESTIDLGAELALMEKHGARALTQNDPEYPEPLREIHDPPIVLYIIGSILESDKNAVGVVGTRKPSHYATETTKKLSYQLAYAGLTVVSGLARGIDTAAHQAALAAKGRTIAVIGSGLAQIYPPENKELAVKISTSGAIVSEYPMNRKADRQTFPMRNRIISGMGFGILVIEAGAKSGALISANQAAEQGRSIYAVPGRIDNPGAMGSNRLIQQGARLIMSAQDILEDLGMLFSQEPELRPTPRPQNLNTSEEAIYEAIGVDEPSYDDIAVKSGLPISEVSSTLLALEMRKLIKQLPGGRFVKLL